MKTRDKFAPLGYQAIAPTSSTALTVPAGATHCSISVAVQHCRFTDDGTTPSLTVGSVLPKDQNPYWYAGDLHALLFFNDTAGSLVKVLYYK